MFSHGVYLFGILVIIIYLQRVTRQNTKYYKLYNTQSICQFKIKSNAPLGICLDTYDISRTWPNIKEVIGMFWELRNRQHRMFMSRFMNIYSMHVVTTWLHSESINAYISRNSRNYHIIWIATQAIDRTQCYKSTNSAQLKAILP